MENETSSKPVREITISFSRRINHIRARISDSIPPHPYNQAICTRPHAARGNHGSKARSEVKKATNQNSGIPPKRPKAKSKAKSAAPIDISTGKPKARKRPKKAPAEKPESRGAAASNPASPASFRPHFEPDQQRVLELLTLGTTIHAATDSVGLTRWAFDKWCQRDEVYKACAHRARGLHIADIDDVLHELDTDARTLIHRVVLDENVSPGIRVRAALSALQRRGPGWLPRELPLAGPFQPPTSPSAHPSHNPAAPSDAAPSTSEPSSESDPQSQSPSTTNHATPTAARDTARDTAPMPFQQLVPITWNPFDGQFREHVAYPANPEAPASPATQEPKVHQSASPHQRGSMPDHSHPEPNSRSQHPTTPIPSRESIASPHDPHIAHPPATQSPVTSSSVVGNEVIGNAIAGNLATHGSVTSSNATADPRSDKQRQPSQASLPHSPSLDFRPSLSPDQSPHEAPNTGNQRSTKTRPPSEARPTQPPTSVGTLLSEEMSLLAETPQSVETPRTLSTPPSAGTPTVPVHRSNADKLYNTQLQPESPQRTASQQLPATAPPVTHPQEPSTNADNADSALSQDHPYASDEANCRLSAWCASPNSMASNTTADPRIDEPHRLSAPLSGEDLGEYPHSGQSPDPHNSLEPSELGHLGAVPPTQPRSPNSQDQLSARRSSDASLVQLRSKASHKKQPSEARPSQTPTSVGALLSEELSLSAETPKSVEMHRLVETPRSLSTPPSAGKPSAPVHQFNADRLYGTQLLSKSLQRTASQPLRATTPPVTHSQATSTNADNADSAVSASQPSAVDVMNLELCAVSQSPKSMALNKSAEPESAEPPRLSDSQSLNGRDPSRHSCAFPDRKTPEPSEPRRSAAALPLQPSSLIPQVQLPPTRSSDVPPVHRSSKSSDEKQPSEASPTQPPISVGTPRSPERHPGRTVLQTGILPSNPVQTPVSQSPWEPAIPISDSTCSHPPIAHDRLPEDIPSETTPAERAIVAELPPSARRAFPVVANPYDANPCINTDNSPKIQIPLEAPQPSGSQSLSDETHAWNQPRLTSSIADNADNMDNAGLPPSSNHPPTHEPPVPPGSHAPTTPHSATPPHNDGSGFRIPAPPPPDQAHLPELPPGTPAPPAPTSAPKRLDAVFLSRYTIHRHESRRDFEHLFREIVASHEPQSRAEELTVLRIAQAFWQIRRLDTMEMAVSDCTVDQVRAANPGTHPAAALATTFLREKPSLQKLFFDRLRIYRRTHEEALDRLENRLTRQQQNRRSNQARESQSQKRRSRTPKEHTLRRESSLESFLHRSLSHALIPVERQCNREDPWTP